MLGKWPRTWGSGPGAAQASKGLFCKKKATMSAVLGGQESPGDGGGEGRLRLC